MSAEQLLYILIGSQAGLLGLFIWHLFKCRDVRLDIAELKCRVDKSTGVK